jgi:hypothetical protein
VVYDSKKSFAAFFDSGAKRFFSFKGQRKLLRKNLMNAVEYYNWISKELVDGY